jgi:hypothetical protein
MQRNQTRLKTLQGFDASPLTEKSTKNQSFCLQQISYDYIAT